VETKAGVNGYDYDFIHERVSVSVFGLVSLGCSEERRFLVGCQESGEGVVDLGSVGTGEGVRRIRGYSVKRRGGERKPGVGRLG